MVVMRPPLGGRSTPVPENLKQMKEDRLETVNKQIEALKKVRAMISKQSEEESKERKEEELMPPLLSQRKPRIRVIENVQLVPPRTAWGQQEEDKAPTKDQDETKDKE